MDRQTQFYNTSDFLVFSHYKICWRGFVHCWLWTVCEITTAILFPQWRFFTNLDDVLVWCTAMTSLCLLDEEPEEELTLEQLMERAEGGDARAQTQVSKTHIDRLALGIVVSSCSLTQSGWGHGPIFGWLENDTMLSVWHQSILTHTNRSKHLCNVVQHWQWLKNILWCNLI